MLSSYAMTHPRYLKTSTRHIGLPVAVKAYSTAAAQRAAMACQSRLSALLRQVAVDSWRTEPVSRVCTPHCSQRGTDFRSRSQSCWGMVAEVQAQGLLTRRPLALTTKRAVWHGALPHPLDREVECPQHPRLAHWLAHVRPRQQAGVEHSVQRGEVGGQAQLPKILSTDVTLLSCLLGRPVDNYPTETQKCTLIDGIYINISSFCFISET